MYDIWVGERKKEGERERHHVFHLHLQSRTPALIFEHVDNTDFKVIKFLIHILCVYIGHHDVL